MLNEPKPTQQSIRRSRSAQFAADPHVQALTVSPQWIEEGDEVVFVRLQRWERECREYHMRRMWATLLLHGLKGHGLKWEEIENLTGRSRATWLNVTNGKVPTREYFQKREVKFSQANRGPGRPPVRHRDPEIFGVSRSFIFDVTKRLKSLFSIHTEGFVAAFNQGMRMYATADWSVARAIIQSCDGTWQHLKGDDRAEWPGSLSLPPDATNRMTMVTTHWTQGEDHDTEWRRARPDFPLLDAVNSRHEIDHDEVVLRHLEMIEGHRFGLEARTKGWAHRQRQEREFKGVQEAIEHEAASVDPVHFSGVKVPTESVIKADDGTNPLADLGFHTIPVNLDVHPNMVGDDGQVTFTVTLQYRDGVCVGKSMMANPTVKQ